MSIPSERPSLYWTEPFLFRFRTLGLAGWLLIIAVFAGFAGLFAIVPAGNVQFSPTEKVLLPLIIGLLFCFLLAMPGFKRLVVLHDKAIHCVNLPFRNTGFFQCMVSTPEWHAAEIKRIELQRPGASGNPYAHGILIVYPKYGKADLIGVAPETRLVEVADELHQFGIEVELSDWKPAA